VDVAKAVLTTHRDFGDRTNRKHARLKYVIEERGADWVREEINRRAGFQLEAPAPSPSPPRETSSAGTRQLDGRWFLGSVGGNRPHQGRNGPLKTALRNSRSSSPSSSAHRQPECDPRQYHRRGSRRHHQALLAEHGVPTENQATILPPALDGLPRLPTCGLGPRGIRTLPARTHSTHRGDLRRLGLGGEEIIIRNTGCPNGCARPYNAEIAFVGKAPGRYQIWLGGDATGTRLNRLWKDAVKEPDHGAELRTVLSRYAIERQERERFGDWVARVLCSAPSLPPPRPPPHER
jgi:sulfite reductase (NADPH) hemoprotein beta-component